ncbi:hypothetical protein JTE90_005683 [Oedothorax gibbosus]|uniref:Uncharacterized protein n=1 Tax=Oedothorax gibbosus TaxID=931172 RepID=A0AAV6TLG0_9ARAC|nr:hypothetical protein JTE90_005683 [Oedothorax gibbosus]
MGHLLGSPFFDLAFRIPCAAASYQKTTRSRSELEPSRFFHRAQRHTQLLQLQNRSIYHFFLTLASAGIHFSMIIGLECHPCYSEQSEMTGIGSLVTSTPAKVFLRFSSDARQI